MQLSFVVRLSLIQDVPALFFASGIAAVTASLKIQGPTTSMAGLEGEGCPGKECWRCKVVCDIEEECRCAHTDCKLEWCQKYTHDWKLDCEACSKTSCPWISDE